MIANDITDCYKCIHKRSVPGNAHIMCANPDPKMKGHPHGIANGWFIYPLLFDPVWKEVECANMEWKDNRVFLGGTCAQTTWREELIPLLDIQYFNPVVEDWTEECQKIEEDEKEKHCNIHLYYLTNAMQGVFSIAEAVDSVHDKRKKTVVVVNPCGFESHELKSLKAFLKLIEKRGGSTLLSNDITEVPKLFRKRQ